MDIHILHGGIEIGPFSEVTAQTLLKQGSVLVTDLAWSPGMPDWVPLVNLLYSQGAPASATAAAAFDSTQPVDPATAKQKAFLSYMGLPFDAELSKEKASQMVNDTLESPCDPARLARWNIDRLKLHPDLFAAEIQARKEGRSQHFLEICEQEGAEYITKITKAHCQVLVGYLDVKFPNWDAEEQDATIGYFFPAVAEKFPQLLTKAAKGKFKYATGQKIAREHGNRSPVAVKARRSSSMPLAALARGVFFGALILAILWFVKGMLDAKKRARTEVVAGTSSTQAIVASPATAGIPNETPMVAAGPAGGQPSVTFAQNAAKAPNTFAATSSSDAGTSAAEMGAPAGALAETPSGGPPTTNSIPLFNPDPPAGGSATAPLSQLISASLPASAPATRNVLLTKPVEIPTAYGKIKLPVGTAVKVLQRNGLTVQVRYLNNTFPLPASSTDLGDDPGPAPAMIPSAPLNAGPAPVRTPLNPASDL